MENLKERYKPKYLQLVDLLRSEILSGRIKEGDRLLSENELKKKYNVSSTTVRRSIDILRNEGLIKRIQGIGTFVSTNHLEKMLERLQHIPSIKQVKVLGTKTEVLEKEIIKPTAKCIEKLYLKPEDDVLKLKRLRYSNGLPIVIDVRYINLKYCPAIEKEDLSGSLECVYNKYGIIFLRAKQNIQLTMLDNYEARLLQCALSIPAFLIKKVTFSWNMLMIEYGESLCRGDEYEFSLEVGL